MADNCYPALDERNKKNFNQFSCSRSLLLTLFRFVTYQKVEDAETEHLEGDTHMTVIVKPVQHLYAQTRIKRCIVITNAPNGSSFFADSFEYLLLTLGILAGNFLESEYLEFCSFAILLDVFYDFQRHHMVPVDVKNN